MAPPSDSPQNPTETAFSKPECDIGIVTAFFDIGRGDWTPANNLPGYLERSTELYLERFGHMASLDNEMVIYTSPELAVRVMELRKGREEKTTVIPFILKDMFKEKREAVKRVHADPEYQKRISPDQIRNPEYWSADYVVVTNLKPVFVAHAVQNNLIKSKQVAWMDFGYCRSRESLGGSAKWQYSFTPGKIHLFTFCDFPKDGAISEVVANNIVVVAGAAVVANRELWPVMAKLMNHASDELLKRNMVDDDQTLFLMASLYEPDLFELHRISDSDWQPVLRLFNNNAVKI